MPIFQQTKVYSVDFYTKRKSTVSIFLKIRQCEDDYSTKSELKFDSVKLLMHRLCSMIIVDFNDKEIHSKLIGNSIDLLHRQLYLLLISGLTF